MPAQLAEQLLDLRAREVAETVLLVPIAGQEKSVEVRASDPPASNVAARRPNDPPSALIENPGLSFPVRVLTTSVPPSAFRPKIGLEPGCKLTVETAFIGMRSQLTIAPKGSLTRTPSK